MARPVEFDRDQALDAAMRLFWRQGYGATSLPQLLSAMGLSRSSLYAGFGDKRQLFIAALERYFDMISPLLERVRSAESSEEAVRLYFRNCWGEVHQFKPGDGCLVTNTVLELADVDPELSALAVAHIAEVEKAFGECFARAQTAGNLRVSIPTEQLAKLVMTFNQGIRVLLRTGATAADLRQRVEAFIQLVNFGGEALAEPEMAR